MKVALKKIVSIAICFAMLMTLLPKLNFVAFADEGTAVCTLTDNGTKTNYSTMEDGISAAQNTTGGTLTLLCDVETTKQIKITKGKFTIDLNGKTWTLSTEYTNDSYVYQTGGEVTFNDNKNSGKMTTGNDTLIRIDTATSIFEAGTYESTNDNFGDVLYIENSAETVINGGTFEGSSGSVSFKYCDKLTLNGGNFNCCANIQSCKNINISGCSFKNDLNIHFCDNVKLSNNSFNCDYDYTNHVFTSYQDPSCHLIIYNSKVTISKIIIDYISIQEVGEVNNEVTINDSDGEVYVKKLVVYGNPKVNISGGIYDNIKTQNLKIDQLLADGYAFTTNLGRFVKQSDNTKQISGVTVREAPFKISSQPQSTEIKYGDSVTLSTSQEMNGGYDECSVSYQWYKDGSPIEDANNATLEKNDLSVGVYQFYCIISCLDYETKTETAKVTVSKADTKISNKDYATDYTYNGSSIPEPTADNFESNSGSNLTFTWFKGDSTADSDKLESAPKELGNYTLEVSAVENDYYTYGDKTFPVKISYLETDAVATLDGVKNDAGWYKGVDIVAPDGFKIATSQDSLDWQNKITIKNSMNEELSYYLKEDSTGYITDKKTIAIKNDKKAPTIGTITYSEHQTFLDWIFNKHSIEISVPVSDDCSGIKDNKLVYYCVQGTSSKKYDTDVVDGIAKISISSDFVESVLIESIDNAGNVSNAITTKMAVEGNAPTISILDGTNEFSETTAYNCDKSLNISVADTESGIKSVSYSIDDGEITTLFDTKNETKLKKSFSDNSINVLEGTHTYTVTAVDNALNQTTKKLKITKDTTPPSLTSFRSYDGTDTAVSYGFRSDEEGTLYYVLQKRSDKELNVDDVLTKCSTPTSFTNILYYNTFNNLTPNTQYCCYFVAKDDAGNISKEVYKLHFETEKTSIKTATMLFDNSDFTYNGNEQKPDTTLKIGDRTLSLGTDYTISYKDNKNVGTATVTATATDSGNYKDSITKTFEIKKAELTPTISGTTSKVYDGTQTVSNGLSIELSEIINDDTVNATAEFTLDNKNVGENKTVTANNIKIDNNNYTLKTTTATAKCGEVTARPVKVTISGDTVYAYNGLANFNNSISYETVGDDEVNGEVLYNGSQIKPTAVGNYSLSAKIKDSNYKLSETEGVIGLTIKKAYVSLDISANNSNPIYGDSENFTATVDKDNLFDTTVTDLKGKVKFYLDDELLGEKDVDNFNKSANITIDKSKLTLGNHEIIVYYSGNDNIENDKSSLSLSVGKYTLTDKNVTLDNSSFTYNGNEQMPKVSVIANGETLKENTDYTLSYNDNKNVGTATVTVKGIGNFNGSVSKTFEIKKAELTLTISGTTSKVYDGTQAVLDGLSIELSGIINNDTVNATAEFTLDNKNVGENKTVTANNIKIDNNNYTLKTTTATAKCGQVTTRPVSATISGDTVYAYNGLANFNNSISYETVGGDKVNGEVLYNGSEIKPTAVGTYPLTAKIKDSNYRVCETEGVTELTINKANVTLDISSNNPNPTYGDSDILTATVDKDNSFNTAVADLSGKVKFYLDDELLGEKDVDNFNKSASVTVDKSKLTAGDHEIYAKYIGNDNINQSKSSEISTKVSKRTLNYDTSKLSVATKKYDGTTTATINGTLLVSNILDGDDVGFSYSGLNGKFKSEKAGAEDVELNIIGATITNNNYQLPESVPSIKGIIKIVTTINNVPESTNDEKYQLEAEYGFSEIPETLKNNPNFNTEEKIKALMKLTVQKSMSDVNKDNISIFDLTLRMSKDGGKTWQIVDNENFPKEGITVNLPYPKGTNKDDFDFLVTHMFTKKGIAGTTENIIPTKTDNGLEFKLYSLSPVALGFKKIVKENPVTSETNPVANTTENKASETSKSPNPKTGACGGILPIALVTLMFGGTCFATRKKKNK